jgi:hypothetical protein
MAYRAAYVLAEMIATRGFVRIAHSLRVRRSLFPTDAEALRAGHPQIRLALICVLVCRGYRIPCSDCSLFFQYCFESRTGQKPTKPGVSGMKPQLYI